jgi:hypothetical protein
MTPAKRVTAKVAATVLAKKTVARTTHAKRDRRADVAAC